MSWGLGILLVLTVVCFVWWARRTQQDEDRQRKDRLDLKLKLIDIEKQIGDERHRAEAAEHNLRQMFSEQHISLTQQLITALESPEPIEPRVFLNGQLLQLGGDYEWDDEDYQRLRFEFVIRNRDVMIIDRGSRRHTVTFDQQVDPGTVVALTSTPEPTREEVQAALRKVAEDLPQPEPPSRYELLMDEEDEDGPQEPV